MKCLRVALAAAGLAAAPLMADDAGRQTEALFSQLDKNSDGRLSRSEVPEDQARFLDRLLRTGDADGDGELTREEFAAGANRPEPQAQDRPEEGRRGFGPGGGRPGIEREMFERMDRNSDGKLERDELPEQARERLAPLFERLGKSSLTLEDFQRLPERNAGPGRPGGGRPGGEMLERLRRLDANKDGKVALDEVPEEERDRFRIMADRIGDGESIDIERTAKQFERFSAGRPDGDCPRPDSPDGDRPRPEFRDGDRPRPEMRDGDGPRPEFRDGERPRPEEGDRPRGEPFGDQRRPDMIPPILRVLDVDRDGRLSRDELEEIEDQFERLDRNRDGRLDGPELFGAPHFGPGMPREGDGPRGFAPREGDRPPRDGFRPPHDDDDRDARDRDDDDRHLRGKDDDEDRHARSRDDDDDRGARNDDDDRRHDDREDKDRHDDRDDRD